MSRVCSLIWPPTVSMPISTATWSSPWRTTSTSPSTATRKTSTSSRAYVGNLAYLHEAEYKVATQAVACINQRFGVRLPKEEAAAIALHLINAENSVAPKADFLDASTMISDVIGLIEKRENITIDRSGFNASRFITHMEYLLARIRNNETLENNNDKLFNNLKQEYRETYLCAEDVRTYLQQKTGKNLGSEEMSYLMLHIERFCSREQA